MSTNYNDERLTEVESQKAETMAKVNATYDSMINQSDNYYKAQIDATKSWEEKQSQLQQERTDFTIEQIEQQKEQAQKDYTKEQSASYVDWQKESNKYGANAEEMATSGLTNTGYGESSQVSMYNTYQNRVATAREVYNRAVLNYNNSIKDAQLQNNSALAEIAYNSLYQQLEISLAGFQYKNELILGKLNAQMNIDNTYYGRYTDVLGQINAENSLAEQIRQYNASLEEEKRQYNTSLEEEKRQYDASLEEKIRQYNTSLEEEKRQYNSTLNLQKEKASGNSSGVIEKNTGAVAKESDNTKIDAKATGFRVGNVLTTELSAAFGLSRTTQIVASNGTYYAKEGDKYIDLTPIKEIIVSNMNLQIPSIKTMR